MDGASKGDVMADESFISKRNIAPYSDEQKVTNGLIVTNKVYSCSFGSVSKRWSSTLYDGEKQPWNMKAKMMMIICIRLLVYLLSELIIHCMYQISLYGSKINFGKRPSIFS